MSQWHHGRFCRQPQRAGSGSNEPAARLDCHREDWAEIGKGALLNSVPARRRQARRLSSHRAQRGTDALPLCTFRFWGKYRITQKEPSLLKSVFILFVVFVCYFIKYLYLCIRN